MKLKHLDLAIYTIITCVFARRIWKRCLEPGPVPNRDVRIVLSTTPTGAFLAPFDSVDSAGFMRLVHDRGKRLAEEYRRQRRPLDYDAVPTCGSC